MNYRLSEAPFAVLSLAWLAYWMVAAANVTAARRREPLVTRFAHVALSVPAGALLERFPEAYARYRAEVPALIPCIGRARASNNASG